jgi:hypothetical protein
MLTYTKFIEISKDDLIWDFSSPKPRFSIPSQARDWPSTIYVEPFPCTGIVDIELVKKEAERVQNLFPIGTLLTWFTLPLEEETRCNAWASADDLWGNEGEAKIIKEKHIKEGRIGFTARRTIIHPALVKYLVAHEYGHQVDYWINAKIRLEEKLDGGSDHFRDRYAEFRKIPNPKGYHAGESYKNSLTEIVANDFRIVVCEQDVDIYPHYVENPHGNAEIKAFWNEIIEKYAFKEPDNG